MSSVNNGPHCNESEERELKQMECINGEIKKNRKRRKGEKMEYQTKGKKMTKSYAE